MGEGDRRSFSFEMKQPLAHGHDVFVAAAGCTFKENVGKISGVVRLVKVKNGPVVDHQTGEMPTLRGWNRSSDWGTGALVNKVVFEEVMPSRPRTEFETSH